MGPVSFWSVLLLIIKVLLKSEVVLK